MYRHFAVITVGITACLAMFADGENREAMERELAHRKNNSAMVKAENDLTSQGKGGNTNRNIVVSKKHTGTFGNDSIVRPPDTGVVAGDIVSVGPERTISAPQSYTGAGLAESENIVIPETPPQGMAIEEFEKMRQELLRKKRRQQQARTTSASSADNIFEASRERTQTRAF